MERQLTNKPLSSLVMPPALSGEQVDELFASLRAQAPLPSDKLSATPSPSDQLIEHMRSPDGFRKHYDDTLVSLWNDMYAKTHPLILHLLTLHGSIPNNGYQLGKATALAQEVVSEVFGAPGQDKACAVFSTSGTAANRLCTSPILDSNHAIVCTAKAHLVEREGRSQESQTGSSVYVIDTGDSPITAEILDSYLSERNVKLSPITQKPKIFSLTNPEEDGYVYSPAELSAIAAVCHKHQMLFHIDGARVFHAAAALGLSLREITTDVGVDTIGLGGSKAGLLLSNASVFLPSFFEFGYENRLHNFADSKFLFDFLRGSQKRAGLLCGQSELLASQITLGLHDNFLVRIAKLANEKAELFCNLIEDAPDIRIYTPQHSNVAIVSVSKEAHENFLSRFDGVKIWKDTDPQDPKNLVLRFVFNATLEDDLIRDVVELLQNRPKE